MPLAVIGPRLFTPSHSCGWYAWACRARTRRYRSRVRAASWLILTVRVLRPLPCTVISRCHRSTSLRCGSPGSYRMPASSDSRIPVALSTAIMAASRHCWNDRPAHARSIRSSSPAAKTGTGLPGTCGGFSPAMGFGDLLLAGQPLEELLQGAELVAGVGGAVPLKEQGHPLLHVALAHLLPPCVAVAGRREQAGGGEPLHRLGIGPDRLGGLALGGQVQAERADLRLEAPGVQRLSVAGAGLQRGHGLPSSGFTHHPPQSLTACREDEPGHGRAAGRCASTRPAVRPAPPGRTTGTVRSS